MPNHSQNLTNGLNNLPKIGFVLIYISMLYELYNNLLPLILEDNILFSHCSNYYYLLEKKPFIECFNALKVDKPSLEYVLLLNKLQ